MNEYKSSVLSIVLPVPFILWFMGRILKWMKTRQKLKKIADWIDKKVEKNRQKIVKCGIIACSVGAVAQLVEQRPEEPCVVGSSPTGATRKTRK